jgi:hypothetical protein
VVIQYEIPRTRPDWTLPEEPVPLAKKEAALARLAEVEARIAKP